METRRERRMPATDIRYGRISWCGDLSCVLFSLLLSPYLSISLFMLSQTASAAADHRRARRGGQEKVRQMQAAAVDENTVLLRSKLALLHRVYDLSSVVACCRMPIWNFPLSIYLPLLFARYRERRIMCSPTPLQRFCPTLSLPPLYTGHPPTLFT